MTTFDQSRWATSVPIIIDDVKYHSNFSMTRAIYFSFQAEEPQGQWRLGLEGLGIPFLMLGLSGIILQPSPDRELFLEPQQIDLLFDLIEARDFVVETSDVWLPNDLLQKAGDLKVGNVFRVELNLFRLALSFRSGQSTRKNFEMRAHDFFREVRFSKEETFVFGKWSQTQFDAAKQSFPKNAELALLKKHEGGEPPHSRGQESR